MYKDAETSLRKSNRLGDRAASYLVIDRSCLMKNYFTDGTVPRWSDRILSLSAHSDDDGKVPVGAVSSPAECTPSREACCSAAPKIWSMSYSAPTRAASPSCTTPWGTPITTVFPGGARPVEHGCCPCGVVRFTSPRLHRGGRAFKSRRGYAAPPNAAAGSCRSTERTPDYGSGDRGSNPRGSATISRVHSAVRRLASAHHE